jgi:hypothetical protein
MSNYEECRPTEWEEWKKRKETNKSKLLVKIEKNCKFCAHCDWINVGKTIHFSGFDEFYCHRNYGGKRVTVIDMTGHVPENCEHFDVRSMYASK